MSAPRSRFRLRVGALLVAALAPAARAGDDGAASSLNLADLAAYRAALDGKPGGEAVAVTFRDLWDHPERFQGRRVRVEGRVERRFRQAAYGTFPPLVEAWAVSPAGDPFCLVFPGPANSDAGDAAPGARVRFEGVFLRSIRYRGGDADRLAPLVVGDRAPAVLAAAPKPERVGAPTAWGGFSAWDWGIGVAAAVVVVLALAVQALRRRPSRPEPGEGPPPEFVEER